MLTSQTHILISCIKFSSIFQTTPPATNEISEISRDHSPTKQLSCCCRCCKMYLLMTASLTLISVYSNVTCLASHVTISHNDMRVF